MQGDKLAFQTIYNLYKDKVYNTAISYAQNREQAEEITQDVFLKIFKKADSFQGTSKVGTWIYRITVNTSLNAIKKKNFSFFNFDDKILDSQSDFVHPGILLENKEKSKILFDFIYQLPENQKTAFILSLVEDLPRQEVADVMEISLKSVEGLLQRAKENLRKKINSDYPEGIL
ncbi:RNA polymerase sigma factor [Frigoriflavimonas asaccharolytica]|uniref:RNA polymerase sigma factor n=1 Tax=Frigoriflavimonas asaccharolytica TaxID=2735899 RepID=A0A8J8G6E3_9FLAO|nr:RNA polymerase sigma factor [Frigoriflavimonas asaccharolytica]NRS92096.1 RNA polymerase sigma-70 factor (ECF subfamily) [Frigoriflavimonas asaccharolytica]